MDHVLKRLIEKIRLAEIDPLPSDNIYMEDIFEPDIYSEILARLPDDDKLTFIEHPDAILPDGTKTRKLVDLTNESIMRFNKEDQAFWREMNRILSSDVLQKIIVQKFYLSIKNRFQDKWPSMVSVPIIYRDYPGYRISEHTDAPYKIATLQFYFPKDQSQIHLGTSFHQRKEDGFHLLKTNSFKPNSAYAFVRTDNSWHSVKQLSAQETKRNTLALTIYVKGHEYKSMMI